MENFRRIYFQIRFLSVFIRYMIHKILEQQNQIENYSNYNPIIIKFETYSKKRF